MTAAGGQYYFSHATDSARGGMTTVVQSAAVGSTTILVQGDTTQSAEAIGDQIGFADPAATTVASGAPSTNVASCAAPDNTCTIPVASTSGFPAGGGELRVGTTAAGHDGGGGFTGAILKYAATAAATIDGKSLPAFTGVTFVRGSGAIQDGFAIQQAQPYQVTADTCYANDCKITISPALTGDVAAGANVANSGTCSLYATAAATPTSPIAPNGTSYFNGCQWGVAHIAITGNSFVFDPAAIAAGTTVTGNAGRSCTASHANNCGTNFMAFQATGQAPWDDSISQNAMMSNPAFTGCPRWDSGCDASPLSNINALPDAPNASANNGEAGWNNLWSKNSYEGPWQWNVYDHGSCVNRPTDFGTRKMMPAGACSVNFANWHGDWQQDTDSTYSARVSSNKLN